jgi:hypothetical protein
VRISAVLLVIVSLAACNRAKQANNNDAVRQGVVEYLTSKGFDVPKAMTVTVTSVEMKGKEADATVSITPTGGDPKAGMSMRYRLEQKGEKWAVVGRAESGAGGAHEGAAVAPQAPAGSEPHGGGAPPAGGSPKMPSPEDLPPAKK